MYDSRFDGSILGLIGIRLLGAGITFSTLGICYPWAVCMAHRWKSLIPLLMENV